MCSSNTLTTPNTGMGIISVANPNLDGTGTIVDIITGASNGTMINMITVKSQTTNAQGIVRLFLFDGITYFLIQEVMVPATQPTEVVPSFQADIYLPIFLKSGYIIAAATDKTETFTVAAYGIDHTSCGCA